MNLSQQQQQFLLAQYMKNQPQRRTSVAEMVGALLGVLIMVIVFAVLGAWFLLGGAV